MVGMGAVIDFEFGSSNFLLHLWLMVFLKSLFLHVSFLIANSATKVSFVIELPFHYKCFYIGDI